MALALQPFRPRAMPDAYRPPRSELIGRPCTSLKVLQCRPDALAAYMCTPATPKTEKTFLCMYNSDRTESSTVKRRKTRDVQHSCLFKLPTEVLFKILSYLDWREVYALRTTCSRFMDLCLHHPEAYSTIDVTEFIHASTMAPGNCFTHLPKLPNSFLAYVLPSARHVQMRRLVAPAPEIESLFSIVPFKRLVSLDLSFSSFVSYDLFETLLRSGVRLEQLALKGCQTIKDGQKLAEVTPYLVALDLAFSRITSLPTVFTTPLDADWQSDQDHADADDDTWADTTLVDQPVWIQLESINLDSCCRLSGASLREFLVHNLPPSVVHLNLGRLSSVQLPISTLTQLKVVYESVPLVGDGAIKVQPTQLATVDVRGVDYLTRKDIDTIRSSWTDARTATKAGDTPIHIVHNDLMFDDNTEAAYARFIRHLMWTSPPPLLPLFYDDMADEEFAFLHM